MALQGLLSRSHGLAEVDRRDPVPEWWPFDCLDQKFQKVESRPNVLLDGFSDNPAESTHLPNDLFFGPERTVDLSTDYGEQDKRTARSKKAKVRGLIQILSRYKFTMEENTPLDEEIALDPELLGKVFENLLASYNPETRDTARKQTGSFYTPREAVSFMVDEALIAYLEPILGGNDPVGRLRTLFVARVEDYAPDFDETEIDRLVAGLDDVKILDPACGTGAYPMGALHRLVDLLRKLDPENKRWEARQRARLAAEKTKAEALDDEELRQEALTGVKRREGEFKSLFNVGRFDRDYARKLFLIENAIFGSDIQPVAVQIAKLRFFIALICDQKTDPRAPNQGVLPLPNLETRIVAANTLMPIPEIAQDGHVADLFDSEIRRHRSRLQEVRHEHFAARHPATKRRCREKDAKIRQELSELLRREAHLPKKLAQMLADWDPYDQNTFAPFFDPAWMFGDAYLRGAKAGEAGFDIITGNPPYVRQEKIKDQKDDLKPHYPDTFTGTADLYVYFYDRALQLLRSGGVLSYITSNKWYRAAYGEKLRAHLGKTTTLIRAIDFGDAPVFTAIAYPTIVITRKTPPSPKHAFRALNWDPATPNTEIANFAAFYASKASRVVQSSLSDKSWKFGDKTREELLNRTRKVGKPLRDFVNSRVYRGITTGLNDAFVVQQSTRDALAAEKPSASLLKRFVRGSDISRWAVRASQEWLIFTRRGADIGKHPAIRKHLQQFKAKLTPGVPGGRKPGSYEWFEIQDNIAYWQQFECPKIVSTKVSIRPAFALDEEGCYLGNTAYFFPVESGALYLLALLNSTVSFAYAKRVFVEKQNGWYEVQPDGLKSFPVPGASPDQKAVVESTASCVQCLYQQTDEPKTGHPRDPLMRDYYEEILNALVYELYLPDDLHTAGLHFFDLVMAANLPRVDREPHDPAAHLTALRRKFEEIYTPSHPLRAALQKLHTLDPIRIIEGKT